MTSRMISRGSVALPNDPARQHRSPRSSLGFYFVVETVHEIAASVAGIPLRTRPLSDLHESSHGFPRPPRGVASAVTFLTLIIDIRLARFFLASGGRAGSASLKILHRPFLCLRGFAGRERAEIAAAPRLWVFLARVQTILTGLQLSNHGRSEKAVLGLRGGWGDQITASVRNAVTRLPLQVSSFESPANVATHSLH